MCIVSVQITGVRPLCVRQRLSILRKSSTLRFIAAAATPASHLNISLVPSPHSFYRFEQSNMVRPWYGRTLVSATGTMVVIFALFWPVKCRYSDEAEFTLSIPAGKEECLFQNARKNQLLEIEYQVLDAGSMGENSLSVDFTLTAPDGTVMVREEDKPDSVHRLEVKVDGDYKICLGNTRSLLSAKQVYLEVFVDNGDSSREVEDDDPFGLGSVTLTPDQGFNSSDIDKMKARLNRLYDLLNQVERYQEWQKAHEARHRNLVEHNFSKVNWLSFILTVVVVIVGSIQVYIIRGFFDNKSTVHRFFKRIWAQIFWTFRT